jgi:hypothetical protein
MTLSEELLLTITFFDGEYTSHDVSLPIICRVDGSMAPHGRPPYTVLEDALKVLEQCSERYSTLCPSGPCFTVLISRNAGGESTPLVRLDVFARNGVASAGVIGLPPSWDTEPVRYSPDDSAVEIVRKILGSLTPQ